MTLAALKWSNRTREYQLKQSAGSLNDILLHRNPVFPKNNFLLEKHDV